MLVERSARGVRLTEAGEARRAPRRRDPRRLAEAEAELEAIAGLRGGRLRMAAFESAAATMMPRRDRALREPAPGRRAVDDAARARGGGRGAQGRRDRPRGHVRLRASRRTAAATASTHHHLLEDPMYLVLAEDHPLARKRGVRLADLAGEPWIGGAPDCECNRLITGACAARLRAADRVRDRRLRGGAGLRRRRRRRVADRRARPAHDPRRHRRAPARARHARAPDLRHRARRATARPPPSR